MIYDESFTNMYLYFYNYTSEGPRKSSSIYHLTNDGYSTLFSEEIKPRDGDHWDYFQYLGENRIFMASETSRKITIKTTTNLQVLVTLQFHLRVKNVVQCKNSKNQLIINTYATNHHVKFSFLRWRPVLMLN